MNVIAALSLVALALVATAATGPYMRLAHAAALILSAVIPGLILMRRARIQPAQTV
jgi:hypothetical protein